MPARRPARSPKLGGLGTRLLAALLLWGAVHAATAWSQAPPPAQPITAPRTVFSGERAIQVAADLTKDLGPRPMGSEAAAVLRERLVARLERMGLFPEVRRHVVPASDDQPVAGVVHNVVARIYGTEPDWPAAVAMAHTDSVAAGRGVADDLAGVAALVEGVRAHLAGGLPRRSLILLFTDGEEAGLLGARGFVRDDPWMADVGAAINFEARGASGPSRLFQTGPRSLELVERYGERSDRPSMSSVSSWIYAHMPNGTDLTEFIDAGVPGVNFAFIGDWSAYHTPLDDLERLSPASVQHHGENLVAVLRGLDAGPLEPNPAAEGAYGDLFGRMPWSLGRRSLRIASLLVLLAVTWGIGRDLRRSRMGAMGLVPGLAVPLLGLVLAGAFGAGTGWLAEQAAHMSQPWWASGWAGHIALAGATALALGGAARLAGPRDRELAAERLALGVAFLWSLASFCASLFLPAFTHLFLAGSVIAACVALAPGLDSNLGQRFARTALYALPCAALAWAPVQLGISDAFGPDRTALTVVPLAWLGTWLLPQLAGIRGAAFGTWMASGLLVWSGGLFLGAVSGARSEQDPGHMNLIYRMQPGDETARLLVHCPGGALPEVVAQVGGFGELRQGWASSEAAPFDVAPPAFEVQPDGLGGGTALAPGRIQGWLRPGAPGAMVSLTMDGSFGCTYWLDGVQVGVGKRCRIAGLPKAGLPLEVRFQVPPVGPVDLTLASVVPGLPAHFTGLRKARPSSWLPYGRGDRTEIRGVAVQVVGP